MRRNLVIVESPTKAKTLGKFLQGLDEEYVVESSVGHVRDLPTNAAEIPAAYKKEPWARLGVNVEDGFKPLYVVQAAKKKKIAELKRLLKDADRLLLATDEDREGEAISWHLIELLAPKVPVERMVFHEITRPAVLEALQQTRELDTNLVSAQETRRIIDRLYGYEVSPVLWRKVAPRLSAGRVQSIAIRLLVERERERMRFKEASYWDLTAEFETADGGTFTARLHTLDQQRIAGGKDFDPESGRLVKEGVSLIDGPRAEGLRGVLQGGRFRVLSAEEKPFTRAPAAPFTTSTLQQEGNRKLRFDAKRTMRAAQRLYENGYITYMRTDSVVLSGTAIALARTTIEEHYGAEFLPDEPRSFKNKVKNAQEAHEAIRPAGERIVSPEEIKKKLTGGKGSDDEARVYELIFKRTLACQMKDARGRRMVLRVVNERTGVKGEVEAVFQANGNVIDFAGFLRAYVEGADDPDAALSEREVILPPVVEGEAVTAGKIETQEHKTSPPARLTEATLVKTLEERGIGRPSTYAAIIDTIQRREYTFKKGSALVPTFTAMAVVGLMQDHLAHLIDTTFTATMEERLDAISRGEERSLPYLEEFYNGTNGEGLRPLLDAKTAGIDPRQVCSIPIGTDDQGRDVIVRVGRYGPFVQRGETTASLPAQTCPDELSLERVAELLAASEKSQEPLGTDPESGEPVYVKVGRYGPYVQLGDGGEKTKPKMVSLLRDMAPADIDLALALELLALPRVLGQDAEGKDVVAHNGRFGPYIKRGTDTRSLAPEDDLLTLPLQRALDLLAQEKKGRGFRAQAAPLKTFEKVEALDDLDVRLLKGRYGPYVTDGKVNASLPREMEDPMSLTVEQAVELLLARREQKGVRKKAKKKTAKKKKSAKKSARKAAKKTASKGDGAQAGKEAAGEPAGRAGPKASRGADDEPHDPEPSVGEPHRKKTG